MDAYRLAVAALAGTEVGLHPLDDAHVVLDAVGGLLHEVEGVVDLVPLPFLRLFRAAERPIPMSAGCSLSLSPHLSLSLSPLTRAH
jgi:hypothetical protein